MRKVKNKIENLPNNAGGSGRKFRKKERRKYKKNQAYNKEPQVSMNKKLPWLFSIHRALI